MSAPSEHLSARAHARTGSEDRRRHAVPRRSTKGPLEIGVDDPLAAGSKPAPSPSHPFRSPQLAQHRPGASLSSLASPFPQSPFPLSPSIARVPSPLPPDLSARSFATLQDPQIYHVLTRRDLPPPFHANVPSPEATPQELLATGRFHTAAQRAISQLTRQTHPTDHTAIFALLYTRLAALTLLNLTPIAAKESLALGDLKSSVYRNPQTNGHIIPWGLRVLCARLQAIGFGDLRKAAVGYYELARECRDEILRASSESNQDEVQLWKRRLRETGVNIAGVIVEMGDHETAALHLRSMSQPSREGDGTPISVEESRRVHVMEGLVWLGAGDVAAAKRCFQDARTLQGGEDALFDALVQTADGDYDAAVEKWTQLHEQSPDDAMSAQNLALCLLYKGRIPDGLSILESLVEKGNSFRSLLFNLSTMYELYTERSRDRKMQLAEQVAAREPTDSGWEKMITDFKL